MEEAAIELPNGARVPAAPGRYRVVPVPDLNEVDDERFLLEYDFPYLYVREIRARGNQRQFMPDISYVDERTWSRLSPEEKLRAYLPCVPVVVIELMSQTDRIADLQAKVSKFISTGTREGVIVDTRHNRVWIYNKGQRPYFAPLAPIEFDWWPGFTLDCIAIRDARVRARLS